MEKVGKEGKRSSAELVKHHRRGPRLSQVLPTSEIPPRPPVHFPGLSLGTPQLFSSKHALATKEKGLTLMLLSLVAKPGIA